MFKKGRQVFGSLKNLGKRNPPYITPEGGGEHLPLKKSDLANPHKKTQNNRRRDANEEKKSRGFKKEAAGYESPKQKKLRGFFDVGGTNPVFWTWRWVKRGGGAAECTSLNGAQNENLTTGHVARLNERQHKKG